MLMKIEETSENTNLIFLIASIGVTILSLVAILYLTKKSNQIIEEKLSWLKLILINSILINKLV